MPVFRLCVFLRHVFGTFPDLIPHFFRLQHLRLIPKGQKPHEQTPLVRVIFLKQKSTSFHLHSGSKRTFNRIPPPCPCLVAMGIPARHRSSISLLTVLRETSKRFASSGAVTKSFCSKIAKIPINRSIFIPVALRPFILFYQAKHDICLTCSIKAGQKSCRPGQNTAFCKYSTKFPPMIFCRFSSSIPLCKRAAVKRGICP